MRLVNTLLKGEESSRDSHVLACNFAKYSPISYFFTDRLSNKPFLILLLTLEVCGYATRPVSAVTDRVG